MRQLPPLAAIRAFEAAGRKESFTAAANGLGMTQAAVSYQIKALEDRLGAALFFREKGRVRLTPLGARLLPPLTQAFDAIEAAFASHRAEDEQLLTITTTYTFANSWLAWRLGGFQMKHADLAVRMSAADRLIDLRAGEADVAVRSGHGDWDGLDSHKLMDVEFTPMASPECVSEWQSKLGRPLRPSDLTEMPLISPQDDWWKQWFRDWGVEVGGKSRQAGIRLDYQAHEGHAAMAGQGLSVLTPFFWINDVVRGRLAMPFPHMISRRGWSYWLVYPKERRMVPKIKRFRDWLLAEIESARNEMTDFLIKAAA